MAGYFEGQTITMSVEFKNAAGELADPTTVTLRMKPMNVDAVAYIGTDITKDSVGKYHRDVDLTLSGEWKWRWKGTGTVNAVVQGSFVVVADNT